ncbi:MAG: hypothetical protein H8E37_12670 [Planctomycetes bacterium]|nr:hypothetical protein [Planctomycetota bacterium]
MPTENQTLGTLLIGTGLLVAFEPTLALVSLSTYDAVNRARRERYLPILGPVAAVMVAWGIACLAASIPPGQAAQWFLLILGLACIAKGIATAFFSPRLADVSEGVNANAKLLRMKCAGGLILAAALAGWGAILLLGEST